MDSKKIVECLIKQAAHERGLQLKASCERDTRPIPLRPWIATITLDDGKPHEVTFSLTDISDLPGHVKEVDGKIVPPPTDDTFFWERIQRPINEAIDRLAERQGKKDGF